MSKAVRDTFRFLLANNVTLTASSAPAKANLKLDRFRELILTLQVFSATHSNETYDLYVIGGDSKGEWDLVHFPQIATTGAKTFTARVLGEVFPQTITTGAGPDVPANDPAVMQVDTAGSNQGPKTIAAGVVRHGPFGHYLRYELVAAGTSPSINFTIQAEARG